MKKLIKNTLSNSVKRIGKTKLGAYLYSEIIRFSIASNQTIMHKDIELKFVTSNPVNQYRIDTFSTKEPETLDWIDGFSQDSIMWDIGANVGLYSCYAAKARATKVFAFEPSIFNLESLARNIHINDLAASVVIIPLPLADKLTINKMCMTSTDWGEALSTFGADFGFDGKPLNNIFSFSTIGLSMDEANLLLKIPRPDYIKMDVDGLEHLILSGGLGMLSTVKSVLVEINDDFLKQAQDSLSYLMSSGLQMVDKRRWDGVKNSPFQNTYNQIWKRSSIE